MAQNTEEKKIGLIKMKSPELLMFEISCLVLKFLPC
jgi:hypothetical protein